MSRSALIVVLVLGIAALFVWLRGGRTGADGESRLRKICQGDGAQAERLLQAEMSRAPGISRQEAASRAVQRYERDNR